MNKLLQTDAGAGADRQNELIAAMLKPAFYPEKGVRFNQGIYSSQITEKTYGKMFAETDRRLSHGQSVILDASFAQRRYREKLLAVAARGIM